MKKMPSFHSPKPAPAPCSTRGKNVAYGIVRLAVLTTPALRLTLFHFAAGQEFSERTSKARVLVQILTGTCKFSVGPTVHTLKADDLLHLPPGALARCQCAGGLFDVAHTGHRTGRLTPVG